MTPQKQPLPAALRVGAAADYLGIGISTVWQRSREDPDFPKPRKMGTRTTVWMRVELDAYLAGLAAGGVTTTEVDAPPLTAGKPRRSRKASVASAGQFA